MIEKQYIRNLILLSYGEHDQHWDSNRFIFQHYDSTYTWLCIISELNVKLNSVHGQKMLKIIYPTPWLLLDKIDLVVTKVWIIRLPRGNKYWLCSLCQIAIFLQSVCIREIEASYPPQDSPYSVFETTPTLTESGIFFIFRQFVILIAHLKLGWCFKFVWLQGW